MKNLILTGRVNAARDFQKLDQLLMEKVRRLGRLSPDCTTHPALTSIHSHSVRFHLRVAASYAPPLGVYYTALHSLPGFQKAGREEKKQQRQRRRQRQLLSASSAARGTEQRQTGTERFASVKGKKTKKQGGKQFCFFMQNPFGTINYLKKNAHQSVFM